MFQFRAFIFRPVLWSIRSEAFASYRPRPYNDNKSFSRNKYDSLSDEEIYDEEMEKSEGFAHERKVVKDVYKESLTTSTRTDEEIKTFMKKHNITVNGNLLKPVLTINEIEVFPKPVLKEFTEKRITAPTPIQSVCWPMVMSGTDLIGIAQTGSGKTLGYLLPSALHIKAQPESNLKGPTSLVLAPTRELVQQIAKVAEEWLSFHFGIRNVCVYGGSDKHFQIRGLRLGSELCIATPGRLIDLLKNRVTTLANTSMLVLDEADRMLDMGFEPQIREIVERMREDRQTLMFSATWPADVRMLASDFMERDSPRINIGSTELCANENIKQEVRVIPENRKRAMLLDIVHSRPTHKILIFAGTKRTVSSIARELLQSGIRCVESHGDLSQAKRERSLQHFKGTTNVMVATDVAARGLDVQNISLVINVDFPQTVEDYIHRIGRTGRSGSKGEAITFFTEADAPFAKGLISVLAQADQEIPAHLRDIANRASKHNTGFRNREYRPHAPKFSRLSRSSNWRHAARSK
ncbi:DEAD-box ATP-dependent RNA helicase 20-like [Varroa jacobsoni]|uniref:DEAD-box ATP-dependent RNA helicase 20-like n=1 Tax=Varroa jacobsoni TaxID=62625 RepID=UPI000BF49C62|nr:DEAD-box ATP-dependent RNA helicase 20-like [Varroa jacobsoni]